MGMIGLVRRILYLSLIPSVATGVGGSASSASAGPTTSHPRPLCLALLPGIQAEERIPSTVKAASPQTFARSKNDLLAEMDVVLKSLNSVKLQSLHLPT